MRPSSAVTHLVTAVGMFLLGWLVAQSVGMDTAAPDRIDPNRDPAAAFATVLQIEDPIERTAELLAFFDEADTSAALILSEMLEEPDPDLIVDEITEMLFASWWARESPKAAFLHPLNPAWAERHPWMRVVFREWVRQNPAEAAIAAQNLSEGPRKGRLEGLRVIADEWLKLETPPDPAILAGVLKQLDPVTRSRAIGHFLSTLIKGRGLDPTVEFVRAFPPDESDGESVQREMQARMAVVLIDHDVDRAIAWAASFEGHPNYAGINKHLAYYWGLLQGQPALEWSLALPDSKAKRAVIKRAWMSFSGQYPDDARAFVSTRPPNPLMRGIYASYIEGLSETDPEGALELARRAENLELRQAMLAAAGKGWMKHDPQAAAAWLAGAGLPPNLERDVRAIKTEPAS